MAGPSNIPQKERTTRPIKTSRMLTAAGCRGAFTRVRGKRGLFWHGIQEGGGKGVEVALFPAHSPSKWGHFVAVWLPEKQVAGHPRFVVGTAVLHPLPTTGMHSGPV